MIGGIIQARTVDEILEWIKNAPRPEFLTKDALEHMLGLCGALWLHSGDPKDPHAELTSGKCSDGFVDTLRVICYTPISELLAYLLANKLRNGYERKVDWVIGSDHAGAAFSRDVAREFGAKHDFTEKGEGKSQLWKRLKIKEGEIVLQVEELMTTSLTFQEVRKGIREGNDGVHVTFAPVAGVLIHRSDVWKIEDTQIVPFVHYDIKVWEPSECPLCKAGSKQLRPKQNWAELTGKG